tara:strand:- start:1799 stop:2095 length:297 start_codon:yes stop_codon:yes gene_type:complete
MICPPKPILVRDISNQNRNVMEDVTNKRQRQFIRFWICNTNRVNIPVNSYGGDNFDELVVNIKKLDNNNVKWHSIDYIKNRWKKKTPQFGGFNSYSKI